MTATSRVPLGLKLAYTAYMAVLIPVYWHYYGPTNFLYFCDVALILTLVAIWPENALLISMCAVGILVPQALWVADFIAHALGTSLTGMADYMFDESHPLFLRLLSLFHGWLPFLLDLSGLADRIRPARFLVVDRACLGAAAGLFLPDAGADAECGVDAGQHQLRVGHERRCRAELGAASYLAHGAADWIAAACVRAGALRADARHAEGCRLMLAPAAKPSPFLALRFAWRELRGGLRGFGVFVACIALGVMTIAGVGSVAQSLADGLARSGSLILGGDLAFSLVQREANDQERAFLAAHGTVSVIATLPTMARTSDGRSTLVEVKAVDAAYPLVGAIATNPDMPLQALFAQQGDAFGAAIDPALLARFDLKPGDRIGIGSAVVELRATLTSEPDKLAGGIGFGPRVLISAAALRASGLLQPGSLVRWQYRLRLPEAGAGDAAATAIEKQAQTAFPNAGWDIRTRRQGLAATRAQCRALQPVSDIGRPHGATRRRRRRRQRGRQPSRPQA